MIELYLADLTPEKQLEIVEAFGGNNNFDVFPIAVIEIPAKESEVSDTKSVSK